MKTKNTMIAMLSIILLILAGCTGTLENGATINGDTLTIPATPRNNIILSINARNDLVVSYKDTISNQIISVRYYDYNIFGGRASYMYTIKLPQ